MDLKDKDLRDLSGHEGWRWLYELFTAALAHYPQLEVLEMGTPPGQMLVFAAKCRLGTETLAFAATRAELQGKPYEDQLFLVKVLAQIAVLAVLEKTAPDLTV